jgi:hypothetical protein
MRPQALKPQALKPHPSILNTRPSAPTLNTLPETRRPLILSPKIEDEDSSRRSNV